MNLDPFGLFKAFTDPFSGVMKAGYDMSRANYHVAEQGANIIQTLFPFIPTTDMVHSAAAVAGAVGDTIDSFSPVPIPLVGSLALSDDVPLQRKSINDPTFISPSLASTPCSSFNCEQLLFLLNTLQGTLYQLSPEMYTFLQLCINSNCDFGHVYARVRPRLWRYANPAAMVAMQNLFQQNEDAYNSRLRQLNEHGDPVIFNPRAIRGRRVWDLLANRVIPFSYADGDDGDANAKYFAVSHAWTGYDDRQYVQTPVNNWEWPVPLPSGVTLDQLRAELYHLGARYVWLDVVCLRQESKDPQLEEQRQREMLIDIPTMGNIYNSAEQVVVYYNGLGKAFRQDGWNGERHWFKRVWTLLEVKPNYISGGVPASLTAYALGRLKNEWNVSVAQRMSDLGVFQQAMYLLRPPDSGIGGVKASTLFWDMEEVRRRYSMNPLDMVDVIRYSWCQRVLPSYPSGTDTERAWALCVKYANAERQVGILFLLPPNEFDGKWIPSWKWISNPNSNLPSVDREQLRFANGEGLEILPSGALRYSGCIIIPGCAFYLHEGYLYVGKEGYSYRASPVLKFNNFTFSIPSGPYTLVTSRFLPIYLVCATVGSYNQLQKLYSVSLAPADAQQLGSHSGFSTVEIY